MNNSSQQLIEEAKKRFEKKFLDVEIRKEDKLESLYWKEGWDGGDQVVRDADPYKIIDFLSSELKLAYQKGYVTAEQKVRAFYKTKKTGKLGREDNERAYQAGRKERET